MAEGFATQRHTRRFRLLQTLVILALVILLLRNTDLSRIGAALSHANLWLVAGAVLLNVPVLVLYAVRSHMVLVRLGHRVPPELLLPVAIVGNVVGSLTPAGSGEALRAAMLRSRANVTTSDGVALVLYERALSLYLMTIGTVVALAYAVLPVRAALAATAATGPLLALPVMSGHLFGLLERSGSAPGPRRIATLLGRLRRVNGQLHCLLNDRWLMICWCLATACIFALVTLQTWLLARSLVDVIGPEQAWLAFGISQLAAIASLLPLGIGASDVSLAALFHRFGMTLGQGAGVAILVRAAATLPLGIAAVASYLYLMRRAPLTLVAATPESPPATLSAQAGRSEGGEHRTLWERMVSGIGG